MRKYKLQKSLRVHIADNVRDSAGEGEQLAKTLGMIPGLRWEETLVYIYK